MSSAVVVARKHSAPALRRAYFDCRYGQLHTYLAMPAGGGFDEKTAVFCIPGKAGSGSVFQPLLADLGQDRSVYAPDLPGHGLSDAPPAGSDADSQALALTDLLQDLRLRRVHVLVHAEGATAALRLQNLVPTRVAAIVRWGGSTAAPVAPAGARFTDIGALSDTAQILAQVRRLLVD